MASDRTAPTSTRTTVRIAQTTEEVRNRGGTDAVHPQQFIREEGDFIPEQTETPVLDLLASLTAGSIEASNLDAQTLMLVRIAALVAVDGSPASYLMNLGVASELDIDAEQVRDVLATVAPIVGTARVVSATNKIMRALELDLLEIEAET